MVGPWIVDRVHCPGFFIAEKNDLAVPLEAVDKAVSMVHVVCTVLGTEEWMAQTIQGAPTKVMDRVNGGGLWDPEVSWSGGDGGGGVIEAVQMASSVDLLGLPDLSSSVVLPPAFMHNMVCSDTPTI